MEHLKRDKMWDAARETPYYLSQSLPFVSNIQTFLLPVPVRWTIYLVSHLPISTCWWKLHSDVSLYMYNSYVQLYLYLPSAGLVGGAADQVLRFVENNGFIWFLCTTGCFAYSAEQLGYIKSSSTCSRSSNCKVVHAQLYTRQLFYNLQWGCKIASGRGPQGRGWSTLLRGRWWWWWGGGGESW